MWPQRFCNTEYNRISLYPYASTFRDLIKVQTGLGDKVGLSVNAVAFFFGGIIVGFVHSWKLSLVVLAVIPPLGKPVFFM